MREGAGDLALAFCYQGPAMKTIEPEIWAVFIYLEANFSSCVGRSCSNIPW